MEQAKQNEQRLENMIAENDRLYHDLALKVAKYKQAISLDPERPLRTGGQRPRALQQDTDSASDSLSPEPKKKGRPETTSSSEESPHIRHKRKRNSSDEEDQHDPFV